jgi:hypothetical protein
MWVDPYPTRLPRLGDLRTLNESRGQEASGRPDWLELVRVSALPIEPLPFGSNLNHVLCWGEVLKRISSFLLAGKTLIAVGKPSQLALDVLHRHSEHPSLYDAMDDFPEFYTGISRARMRRCELMLATKVDSLWVSSTPLFEKWQRQNGKVEIVKNGLDPAMLEGVETTQKKSSKRIFGYVGTIAAWFDWPWVLELARVRPQDEVRLVGPVSGRAPKSIPSNVRLYPPCSHERAISEMAQFDVGLIPFRRNHLTDSVDPIKYYEYRALGLPVMSTEFGEMRFRRKDEGVLLGGRGSVASCARVALEFFDVEEAKRAFVHENSWEQRFDITKLL